MTKILKETLADILIVRRKELNLTQEKAAEACGISVRAYQYMEKGKTFPLSENLINISIALKIDLNKFVMDSVKAGYVINDKGGI